MQILDRVRAYALMIGLALALVAPLAAQAAAPTAGDPEAADPRVAQQTLERWIDRAVEHYTAGEFADAETLLATVMRSADATERLKALAAFNRGAALLQLDRFADAVESFDAAERRNFPYPAQLHLARGIAFEQMGQPEKAAYEYSSALAADPSNLAVQRRIDAFFHKR
jgi:tetratricopeptide (TPR) repeat protein